MDLKLTICLFEIDPSCCHYWSITTYFRGNPILFLPGRGVTWVICIHKSKKTPLILKTSTRILRKPTPYRLVGSWKMKSSIPFL